MSETTVAQQASQRQSPEHVAWQRACAIAANQLSEHADPKRLARGLDLAQQGRVTRADDEDADAIAYVQRGKKRDVIAPGGTCTCPDHEKAPRARCTHVLALLIVQRAPEFLEDSAREPGDEPDDPAPEGKAGEGREGQEDAPADATPTPENAGGGAGRDTIQDAPAPGPAMEGKQRIYLDGTETTAALLARGLPRSTIWDARRRGYYCPGYKVRAYPQDAGPGNFASLRNPYAFVVSILSKAIRYHGLCVEQDTFQDWTQSLLLECWRRRHAPHVRNFEAYAQVALAGLAHQWIIQRARRLEVEEGCRVDALHLTSYHRERTSL